MRVALTGTPGTGKTTVADLADVDLEVVHLAEVVAETGFTVGTDPDRDTEVVDIDRLRERYTAVDDVCVESHWAHELPVDRVIVLRCHPDELRERLGERGWDEAKIAENVESEVLDVILAEAVGRHGAESVYELDTTAHTPAEVAAEVAAIVADRREPGVGRVNFLER